MLDEYNAFGRRELHTLALLLQLVQQMHEPRCRLRIRRHCVEVSTRGLIAQQLLALGGHSVRKSRGALTPHVAHAHEFVSSRVQLCNDAVTEIVL